MENYNNSKYVQHSYTGKVFKVTPTHLLQVSPWKVGDDRRVFEEVNSDYRVITYKNACMIINNQFDNTVEEWNYKGKKYIANAIGSNKNIIEYSYLLSTLPNHSLSIQSDDGKNELKLVKHKGKMYYIWICNQYLPRVKAFDLFGNFCQWVGIDHVKPIFCETDNRYI